MPIDTMQSLPIDSIQTEFMFKLTKHHIVVEAETGSGKSTRLPIWASQTGRVLVIEPRRIACTSLAQYLASEKDEAVGLSIGYAIKLENCYSDDTQVVFVTPGVALRWFAENKLKSFDVIMVDEFHERRWDTDLLVAMLNVHQQHRLIVTSATIDSNELANYIDAVSIKAIGRNYDVDVRYFGAESHHLPQIKSVEHKVKQAVDLMLPVSNGDLLVFLPGRKEIMQCQSMLKPLDNIIVAPLHASVSDQQRNVALTVQPTRKIVLATNVAETSLTIPNVVCVIDSGLERRTVQRNGRTTLMLCNISQASAKQRAGRAGRVMNGHCIKLYGKHAALESVTPPQLLREDLTEVMMAAATCGYRMQDLKWLNDLPEQALSAANETLLAMNAIDDSGRITAHGKIMSPLPIDALYADLVTRINNKPLKEAMIDLTAALSVPASLYSMSNNPEAIEQLNADEKLCCDGQTLISLVRGVNFSSLSVDVEALKEAKGLAEQMRSVFGLPELEVASRYNRNQLLMGIASLHPELLFVRREKRRGVLANGKMEVLPAKNSRFASDAEAALVLDYHSLPGRGSKQTLDLATVMLPVPMSIFEELELGEWVQGETQTASPKEIKTTKQSIAPLREQIITSRINLIYAGRIVTTKEVEATGDLITKAILDAVIAEEYFTGFAKKRREQIRYWRLFVELGLADQKSHNDITFESWFTQQIELLELSEISELALFNEEDFEFDGIPYWEYEDFTSTYPIELSLSALNLDVEYDVAKKRVYVIYKNGLRKGDPKRWELPRWQGWKIQYKKASRIIDVK